MPFGSGSMPFAGMLGKVTEGGACVNGNTAAFALTPAAIEAGAEDVVSSESGHEIYTTQESLREVAKALEAKFGEVYRQYKARVPRYGWPD